MNFMMLVTDLNPVKPTASFKFLRFKMLFKTFDEVKKTFTLSLVL